MKKLINMLVVVVSLGLTACNQADSKKESDLSVTDLGWFDMEKKPAFNPTINLSEVYWNSRKGGYLGHQGVAFSTKRFEEVSDPSEFQVHVVFRSVQSPQELPSPVVFFATEVRRK